MLLGFFAHDEGVDIAAFGMHNGGSNRVGAEGQATDGREIPICGQLAQQGADEAGGLVMQGSAAEIHVVVSFLARGQGHLAVDDGQFLD